MGKLSCPKTVDLKYTLRHKATWSESFSKFPSIVPPPTLLKANLIVVGSYFSWNCRWYFLISHISCELKTWSETWSEQNHTHLPRRLDSLDHGETNHGPGRQQAQRHLPVESSSIVDAVWDVQGHAVPVVGGRRALLTLWLHIFRQKVEFTMSHVLTFNTLWVCSFNSF